MRKLGIILSIAAISFTACQTKSGQNESSNADSTNTATEMFGAKIDETGAVSMDSLLVMMNNANGEIPIVKVEGKILECCQTKGCWMNVDKGDGTGMRVTFKDYAFFVPKNSGGKDAVFSGRAYMDTTTVEQLRHYAEDEGLSKAEIEKIIDPKVELTFEADGVIIK